MPRAASLPIPYTRSMQTSQNQQKTRLSNVGGPDETYSGIYRVQGLVCLSSVCPSRSFGCTAVYCTGIPSTSPTRTSASTGRYCRTYVLVKAPPHQLVSGKITTTTTATIFVLPPPPHEGAVEGCTGAGDTATPTTPHTHQNSSSYRHERRRKEGRKKGKSRSRTPNAHHTHASHTCTSPLTCMLPAQGNPVLVRVLVPHPPSSSHTCRYGTSPRDREIE
ncbi:hypothetical protein HOY82DRAFT_259887 [Tuber indicum]|nr:hypothetical protein HOY82DRAFT_259887 [Tuber indicum]